VFSPQRFSKRNMLHFLCGAVSVQLLAVAMEHERTYLLERTSGKTTARPIVCRSKQVHTSWIQIFDSERLITEVEKRPALYNKATPENSDKHCKETLWIEVCEAVVPNWSRMGTRARVATGKSVKKKHTFFMFTAIYL
jgi:hypothetical protein